jgi:hypothetical protein
VKLAKEKLVTSHSDQDPQENVPTSSLTAFVRFVFGQPLANREIQSRQIGVTEGAPALGLDGLSSTAYGPEAALTILAAAGAAGTGRARPPNARHPALVVTFNPFEQQDADGNRSDGDPAAFHELGNDDDRQGGGGRDRTDRVDEEFEGVDAALRDDDQLQFQPGKPLFVLVMTKEWNRLTDRAFLRDGDFSGRHRGALGGARRSRRHRAGKEIA